MAGMTGVAQTDISPRGWVQVQGEHWEAESSEPIRAGENIEVTGIEGLRLRIRRR
jgi:membrane-bound serine protease (ClpP class)